MRGLVILLAACGTPPPLPPAPKTTPPATTPPAAPSAPSARTPVVATACTSARPPQPVLDTSGQPLTLLPASTDHIMEIGFAGEDLVMLRDLAELGYGGRAAASIERWSLVDPKGPKTRAFLPARARTVAVSDDGKRVIAGMTNVVAVHDAATGAQTMRFVVGGEPSVLATNAAGDVLVGLGSKAELHDAAGNRVQTIAIGGTTPTIKRVYGVDRNHPTMHRNVLDDAASWATALALDAKHLAIGGSDSKVRLYQRGKAKAKLLEFPWKYTERRHMGGNPDLNMPLVMRFTADGKRLVVVHEHGEIATWNVERGTLIRKLAGPCSPAEGAVYVNRYNEPGAPAQKPTPEELVGCGRAITAALAPDASWSATENGLIRVRAPKPAMVNYGLGVGGKLAISRGGKLVLVDLYGTVQEWTPAKGLTTFIDAGDRPTLEPQLSSDGRVLVIDRIRNASVWDLATGRRLAANVATSSADGSRTVVKTQQGFELHPGGPLDLPAREVRLSTDGSHLLVRQDSGIVVRNLATKRDTKLADRQARPLLSPDGKYVAMIGRQAPLEIIDTATGKTITLEVGGVAVAYFRDGRFATAIQREREAVIAIRDAAGKPTVEFEIAGWVNTLAISPDQQELLVGMQHAILRYDLPTKRRHQVELIGDPHRVRYSQDGSAIWIETYNQIFIRRADDALTAIATLYALDDGYLAISAAGAVTGSGRAHDQLFTIAKSGTVAPVEWDRWARADTLTCALSGEIAAP